MNYQNVLCVGDSLTFGARTYGCYPLVLGALLNAETPYTWQVINESHNGHTCRDLWFAANRVLHSVSDTYIACILIGTNDVGNRSDAEIFEEYYRQILNALRIKRYKHVLCGLIPPIFPDGHAFFDKACVERRQMLNDVIRRLVEHAPGTRAVALEDLVRSDYEDAVHFGESGNRKVARRFADAIRQL